MIWFYKILKLIFQKQPSCPRNICTGHLRKLPNLTAFLGIFLYLKNSDSVEHVWKVLLIVLCIKVQIFEIFECSSQNSSNSSCQFWNEKPSPLQILHYSQFSWHITLLKLKHFILWIKGSHQSPNFDTFKCSGENLPNSSCHLPKHKPVFPQILHHCLVSWKKSPWYFLGQTYFLQKESIKVQSFETFKCSVKIAKSLSFLKQEISFSSNFA